MTQIYTAQKKLTSKIMYEQIKIMEKDILSNTNQRKAGMAMALSNKVDLKANLPEIETEIGRLPIEESVNSLKRHNIKQILN